MTKKEIAIWANKINMFPTRAFAICMGSWGIIEMLGNWNIKPFDGNFTSFILTVIIIIVSVEFVIFYLKEEKSKGNLIEALTEEAEKMLDEGRNEEILRRRNSLSRSLWIEGKPNERIKLGEIAKEASIRLGNLEVQTEILIDDLGWTLVSIQHYQEAKEYLIHGLDCALQLKNNYWAAKANRHLAGISLEAKDFTTAKKYMIEAEKYANLIPDKNKKSEMLGGIYYGLAVIFLQEKNTQQALVYAEETEKLRSLVGDQTRYVKVFSLKGTIYEAMGNKSLSEDNFIKGLEYSNKIGRADEIIRNHLGLARIAKAKNDSKKYNQHLMTASELLKKTPVPFKIDEKEISLIQI